MGRNTPISRAFFLTDPTWRPSNSATIAAANFLLASTLSRPNSLSVHSLGRGRFIFLSLFNLVRASSPTIGDALNAGYGYIEVRCLGCDTNQTAALNIGLRQRPFTRLSNTCRCKDCSQVRGYAYKRSHLVALRSTKISPIDPPSTWWPGERQRLIKTSAERASAFGYSQPNGQNVVYLMSRKRGAASLCGGMERGTFDVLTSVRRQFGQTNKCSIVTGSGDTILDWNHDISRRHVGQIGEATSSKLRLNRSTIFSRPTCLKVPATPSLFSRPLLFPPTARRH